MTTMTGSRFKRTVAGVLAAGMLAIPGCVPKALAADPTQGMISTATALEQEYDLPAGLLLSVAEVESDFNPSCRTGKCHGLMQIHSSYSDEYAKLAGLDEYDLFDYRDSMRIGAAMLDLYLDRYQGDLHYALMCYNLGEAGAKARRRDGAQTTGYSRKVIGKIERWACAGLPDAPVKDAETAIIENPAAATAEDLMSVTMTAAVTGVWQRVWEVLIR